MGTQFETLLVVLAGFAAAVSVLAAFLAWRKSKKQYDTSINGISGN